MFRSDDNGPGSRGQSLLTLGDQRGKTPAPSKLSQALAAARAEREAAAQRRIAQSRRTARENPLLGALNDSQDAMPASASHRANAGLSAEDIPDPDAPNQLGAADDRAAVEQRVPDDDVRMRLEASERERIEQDARSRDEWDRAASASIAQRETEITARAKAGAPVAAHTSPAPQKPPRRAVFAPLDEPDGDGRWQPFIDPGTVVAGIIKSKWIVLVTTVAGAVLGVMIALGTPKKYETWAEIQVDPSGMKLVDRELVAGGLSNEATLAIIENQVRILMSSTVLEKVVTELNLAEDPEFNGQGDGGGVSGMMSAAKSIFRPSDGEADIDRRHALAAAKLSRSIAAQRAGKTFNILIEATTEDPDKSARIANAVVSAFMTRSAEIQAEPVGRASDELKKKIEPLRKEVEEADRKAEAFRQENDLINAQGRLITDDELLKLNEQLSVARARRLELVARAESSRDLSTVTVLSGVLPEELSSPTMQELRAQYAALKNEADKLAVNLGPKHPQYQAAMSQLQGAGKQIENELKRTIASTRTELKRATQLEQELSSRLAQLKVRQGGVSNEMVTLRSLEADAADKRDRYERFLRGARETEEQKGINNAKISWVSEAQPPMDAVGPSRSMIAIAGIMLGFLAGVGIGAARGTWDSLRDRYTGNRPSHRWNWRRPTSTMFDAETPDNGSDDGADDALAPEPARVSAAADAPPVEEGPARRMDSGLDAAAHSPQPAPTYPPSAPAAYPPAPEAYSRATRPDAPEPVSPEQPTPPHPQPQQTVDSAIDEIRASLRECRQAIRELAESRARRRYF